MAYSTGSLWCSSLLAGLTLGALVACSTPGPPALEEQFRELPVESRRLTGPLFWLHGDESPELLTEYVGKVAAGGNGCFTAESRPHVDWLGPGWYHDLEVCLEAAKRHDLEMWIFDEKWWPSGEVGGQVPLEYGSKFLEMSVVEVEAPNATGFEPSSLSADRVVAIIGGRETGDGIDPESLVDLTWLLDPGERRAWKPLSGEWRVMIFTYHCHAGRRRGPVIDGASQKAVDWYIDTVYQPHYDHFPDDFGETIVGYFYDEPETHGDWGTEVIPMLKERGVDWMAALVAWKGKLAGEAQVTYRYQYQDALAEAWGRTLYGGIEAWCREHGVESIGHFLEHSLAYLNPKLCAGNIFQLMKYSSMGGIDAVFAQFVMGKHEMRGQPTWQTPKLGSSISHAYGKRDDLAMVEIFGARGQDLTYREMKWWTDHMQVSGINFHIPHAFNPRSPHDRDCPPYFYNNGEEPRWPLYRVYADYTSRLSLMLSGGRHVCPVALLFLGNSYHVGAAIPPEKMATALQDALFDNDWLPYEVLENDVVIDGPTLRLREEAYRVLVVPAVEVIPYASLARAREYFEAGGVVVGYGMLPSLSATPGRSAAEIDELVEALWGQVDQPGTAVCRTSQAGGRSYFLPAELDSALLAEVLTVDAGIRPTMEVLAGEPDDLLHVLHRVKQGRDVFFLCNQQHLGPAQRFELRFHAPGVPEIWDPLRGETYSIAHERRPDGTVELALELEPLESLLVVFGDGERARPARCDGSVSHVAEPLVVERLPNPPAAPRPERERSALVGCPWIWFAGDGDRPPGCSRYFRGSLSVDPDRELTTAQIELTADNDFVLYVGGEELGRGSGDYEGWRRTATLDLTPRLRPGANRLAVVATNFDPSPNPAGLIGRYELTYADGSTTTGCIDGSWRASDRAPEGWTAAGFDDSAWPLAKEVATYGGGAWGAFDDEHSRLTLSPVTGDPFEGRFLLPSEWLADDLRVVLEAQGFDLGAAAVRVNGEYAGGFIGAPFRLEITDLLQRGENTLRIEPRAPTEARIVAYPLSPVRPR